DLAVKGVQYLLKKCFEGSGLKVGKNHFNMSFSQEGCKLPLTSIRFRGQVDVQYDPSQTRKRLEITFKRFAIFKFAANGKVHLTLEKDKKKELTAFNNSMLSFKNELPRSISQNTLEEKGYQIAKNPIMGTKFLGLFMPNEKLKNKQLRKAIQYSIDREYIVDSLLRGVGKPAHEGIIPPIFAKYQSEPEIGYSFNEKSAKHSIELSGFELTDLKGLDIITTNREEDIMLAESLRDMIRKNIGLELSVKYFHPDEYYPLIEKGKASLFIDGYFGDYPSPENFLHTLFYGKFVPESLDEYPGYNIYRYKNPFYDNLLDSARYSQTNFERMVYFQKAERLLMLDAVIVPLYYFELEYALDEKVRGFKMNPLKTFDLRHAYFSS
ncbi:MAG: ABC transporter substrate-binding protein, partial [Bacteroidota bacterium]